MIAYLVAATAVSGRAEAARRGWVRIAADRFVTSEKHDIRVVTRISDLVPLSGVTLMLKGPDYDEGPPEGDSLARRMWFGADDGSGIWGSGQRAEFEGFVGSGRARWVESEADLPVNRGVQYEAADGREF